MISRTMLGWTEQAGCYLTEKEEHDSKSSWMILPGRRADHQALWLWRCVGIDVLGPLVQEVTR
jgi:hypothetical protein